MAMIILLVLLIFFAALGVPLAFAIGASCVTYITTNAPHFISMVPQRIWNGAYSELMIAMPLFMLAGELMNTGGITKRIINFCLQLLRPFHGGLGEVNIVASMIFEYYGMTFDDIIAWGGKVEYADWGTSVENIKDGRTDFICHNITQGHAAVTELASTVDMTFIQFPQDMIDTFVDEKGFSPETLPANCFKGQDTDIRTFGVTSTLFCSTELPDDVAYGIARALCENVEDIRAGHTALQRFTAESACDPGGMGIPLHPGAEQYYKEAGLLE